MPGYLRNEHGWKMHDGEMKRALGLRPEDKWPDGGLAERPVGNVRVWVLPARHDGRRRHRVMCACPDCGWVGSAGRLHQHVEVHAGEFEDLPPV